MCTVVDACPAHNHLDATSPPRAHMSAQAHIHQHPPLSCSFFLTLPLSNPLSLTKPWRIFPFSSTIEGPPRRSFAGATPEIDADELHHPPSSPWSFPKLFLHLPQASSKKNELELHQALYLILKPLPVSHPPPVSSSPPRSTPHCPRLQAMKSS